MQHWFADDDLFSPLERRRGLPLGNQTSQFFANVYLNRFDHFVKEVLRAPGYIRYVDDFVLFHADKSWLAWAKERCRDELAGLRLRLHEKKSAISRVTDGTPFLGYRVYADHRLLPRANVVRFKKRLKRLQAGYACYALNWGVLVGRQVERSPGTFYWTFAGLPGHGLAPRSGAKKKNRNFHHRFLCGTQ